MGDHVYRSWGNPEYTTKKRNFLNIKWETHTLHLHGRINLGKRKRICKVNYHTIQLPELFFHSKDIPNEIENEMDIILPHNNRTYKSYPSIVKADNNNAAVSVRNLDKALLTIYDKVVAQLPTTTQQAEREHNNSLRKIKTHNEYKPIVKIQQYANKIKASKTSELPEFGYVNDDPDEESKQSIKSVRVIRTE